MNKYTRVLVLVVSSMMVLSLTISSTYAAQPPHPRRLPWSGNQIPDPTQQDPEVTVIPRGNHVLVKGARMWCFDPSTWDWDPYVFGDTLVFRETIDWMVIFIDPLEFYQNPDKAVLCKRFGRFTWYDGNGGKVAEGGFRFSGKDEPGYLWAKGDGFVVEGIFYSTLSGMWHEGWYMTIDNS